MPFKSKYIQRRSHDYQLGGASFNPDLLSKKGTKCGLFTEKNRPTQEVQHLISSFWAGLRRIWDQKLIFYGPLYSGPFSEGRFRGGGNGPPPPPPPPPHLHPHPPPPPPSPPPTPPPPVTTPLTSVGISICSLKYT